MNRIKITIFGKDYFIKSEESEEYYKNLALKVDESISEFMKYSVNSTTQSATVMTALSAFDEIQKLTESSDNIRKQIKTYSEETAKAKAERDEALKENESLKQKIGDLENKIKVESLKSAIDSKLGEKTTVTKVVHKK